MADWGPCQLGCDKGARLVSIPAILRWMRSRIIRTEGEVVSGPRNALSRSCEQRVRTRAASDVNSGLVAVQKERKEIQYVPQVGYARWSLTMGF